MFVVPVKKKNQTFTILISLPIILLKKIVAITCNSKDLIIQCEKYYLY